VSRQRGRRLLLVSLHRDLRVFCCNPLTTLKLLWPWYLRYPPSERRPDTASVPDTLPQPSPRPERYRSQRKLYHVELGYLLVSIVKFYSSKQLLTTTTSRQFQNTGDFIFPNFRQDLEYLLDQGVRVNLFYGDADYICTSPPSLSFSTGSNNPQATGSAAKPSLSKSTTPTPKSSLPPVTRPSWLTAPSTAKSDNTETVRIPSPSRPASQNAH
jgi:hypothetical protein